MSHIFISYSRKNTAQVKELVDGLRMKGFVVWQDISAIRGGDAWRAAIQQGIEGCAAFLLLWSAEAEASTEVRNEIDIAKRAGKKIVPVRLDKTDLPPDLAGRNYLEWSAGLEAIVAALPGEIRRQRLGFNPNIGMRDQPDARSFTIDGTELVSAPLLRSSECMARVVAPPDTIVGQPSDILLCLHFFQKSGDLFVSDVFRYVNSLDAENRIPFIALVVSGPTRFDGTHWLDNKNPVHWVDALDTTCEAVEELSKTLRPRLHVFNLAPATLTMALGTKLYRFYPLDLYNFVNERERAAGEAAYQRIMRI
jgi:hypothetical protein